jgi:hypothetical protein
VRLGIEPGISTGATLTIANRFSERAPRKIRNIGLFASPSVCERKQMTSLFIYNGRILVLESISIIDGLPP